MSLELIAQQLKDREWRLRNLYMIRPQSGPPIPFVPNDAQEDFLANIHDRNVILKARQMGFSTLIGILFLDTMLFSGHAETAGIVDKTLPDAQKKLERIRFAYENIGLHLGADINAMLKRLKPVAESSKTSMKWVNGSEVYVGVSLRGGTLQLLHVSEFGYTAFHQPDKAAQVFAGAVEAAQEGLIVFESTHEGGRTGKHYDLIEAAQRTPQPRSSREWKMHFFPWWKHAAYRLDGVTVDLADHEEKYFRELEAEHGIVLEPAQVAWYVTNYRVLKHDMLKEHPSTVGDALFAPAEGSIYAHLIADLRMHDKIRDIAPDTRYPVYTCWDIGQSDSTAIWAVQMAGRDILWLAWYENEGEPPSHYADVIRQWESWFPIAGHFLPHDAQNRTALGPSYVDALRQLRLDKVTVLPRTPDIWKGINDLRELLPSSYFHSRCDEYREVNGERLPSGVNHLEGYRRAVVEAGGVRKDKPVHDHHSHTADAARMFAEAQSHGFIKSTLPEKRTGLRPRAILPY